MGWFQELRVRLGLQTTGFEQGINRAQAAGAKFSQNLKVQLAGAFSVGAVLTFTREIQRTVGEIKDLSEQFALTTDEVQQLQYAASQAGMSFDEFGRALVRIGQARRDAGEGDSDLLKLFERYGITMRAIQDPQLRNIDLLKMIAAAISSGNPTIEDRIKLQDLLGKSAERLITTFDKLESKKGVYFKAPDIEEVDKWTKVADDLTKRAKAGITREVLGKFSSVKEFFSFPGSRFMRTMLGPLMPGIDEGPRAPMGRQPGRANMMGGNIFEEKAKADHIITPLIEGGFNVTPQADALARIGGFTGADGGTGSALQTMNQNIEKLTKEVSDIKLNVERAMI